MTNQEILDNAPEGWTHFRSEDNSYWRKFGIGLNVFLDTDVWSYAVSNDGDVWPSLRSRTDIERIVELESLLSDEVIDLVRCGIGGNYGGYCYDEAIEKYHRPLVEMKNKMKA